MGNRKIAPLDRMQLHRIELYGRHGVYQAEQTLGQRWIIDLDLQGDFRPAALSDQLTATIDYGQICMDVKAIVEQESYQLIEALTERIAYVLLTNYNFIQAITVRVTKPHPPVDIHFQGVTIEITRVQSHG